MKNTFASKFAMMGCLFLAVGCFSSAPQGQQQQQTPTEAAQNALASALSTNTTELVSGINQVILQGGFMKSMALTNPPSPIPLATSDDVSKAIGYLLSNGTPDPNGTVFTYMPDPKFCSELVAKSDPTECEKTLAEVKIIQTITGAASGSVQFEIYGNKPVLVTYGSGLFEVSADLSQVLATLTAVSQQAVQDGGQAMAGLPTTASGTVHASIQTASATSVTFSVGIDTAVAYEGTIGSGPLMLTIPASSSLASITLDTAMLTATVTLSIPAFEGDFSITDSQNVAHSATLSFPGLSGTMTLDDAAAKLSVSGVQIASQVTLDVDGSPMLLAAIATEIDASLSFTNGNPEIKVSNEFDAQIDVNAVAGVMNGSGTVDLSVAAGSDFQSLGNGQYKVESGSLQFTGTGAVQGSLDATAGSCMESGNPLIQVAACSM